MDAVSQQKPAVQAGAVAVVSNGALVEVPQTAVRVSDGPGHADSSASLRKLRTMKATLAGELKVTLLF